MVKKSESPAMFNVPNFECLAAVITEQQLKLPFSGVIHISQAGKSIFSHAYGLANRSDLLPNRLNTRFGIASGGKIFTATAIAQLIDQGKLDFDHPICDFLDGALPQIDTRVTLRHLLSHTSGIPDYFDENLENNYETTWQSVPVYRMSSPADFYPFIKDAAMQFSPGEKFSYNNMGFVLLGSVIEKISGKRFQENIEQKVFGPAWMRSSGYFYSDHLPENCASGYIEEKDGQWHDNRFSIPFVGHGDGGVYTTAADMGRFWKALFDKRFFSEAILEEMLKPHATVGTEGITNYGLGIWMNDITPFHCFYLTGEDPGINFYSAVYPQTDLQITILGNSNGPTRPMHKIIRDEIFALNN
jgi:CubicO group peptidase (beta-lactamase class C family)